MICAIKESTTGKMQKKHWAILNPEDIKEATFIDAHIIKDTSMLEELNKLIGRS